jgi:hypothetical protein
LRRRPGLSETGRRVAGQGYPPGTPGAPGSGADVRPGSDPGPGSGRDTEWSQGHRGARPSGGRGRPRFTSRSPATGASKRLSQICSKRQKELEIHISKSRILGQVALPEEYGKAVGRVGMRQPERCAPLPAQHAVSLAFDPKSAKRPECGTRAIGRSKHAAPHNSCSGPLNRGAV